jgi:hypothetical protein
VKSNVFQRYGAVLHESRRRLKLRDRLKSVQGAVDAGISRQPHPGLPPNIFGAAGPWEEYSTPSSDLRSKLGYLALYDLVKGSLAEVASGGSPNYLFSGSAADLAKAYAAAWNSSKVKDSCIIRPLGSSGNPMLVDLEVAVKSVFDWSFDPYHCPELRWGFASACRDDAAKADIYDREAKLRWNTVKDPSAKTDFNYGNNSSRPTTDFLPILQSYLSGGTPSAFPRSCKVESGDGSANVRSGPQSSAAIVTRKDNGQPLVLSTGASVRAVAQSGNWYSVELRLGGVDYGDAKGVPAWIHSSLLKCP